MGMNVFEKSTWAKWRDVTLPCRKTQQDITEAARLNVKAVFNSDCYLTVPRLAQNDLFKRWALLCAIGLFQFVWSFVDSTKYSACEKAAYAKACLTPCASDL